MESVDAYPMVAGFKCENWESLGWKKIRYLVVLWKRLEETRRTLRYYGQECVEVLERSVRKYGKAMER